MSNNIYKNNENDETAVAVLTWNTTRKRSVYNPMDLPNLRTSSGTGGDGFKYFNNFTNSYERPRSLIVVLRNKLQALTLETRSASLSSSSSSPKNNNNNPNRKLPAHLRHHQYLNGGNGYSVSI